MAVRGHAGETYSINVPLVSTTFKVILVDIVSIYTSFYCVSLLGLCLSILPRPTPACDYLARQHSFLNVPLKHTNVTGIDTSVVVIPRGTNSYSPSITRDRNG